MTSPLHVKQGLLQQGKGGFVAVSYLFGYRFEPQFEDFQYYGNYWKAIVNVKLAGLWKPLLSNGIQVLERLLK